MFSHVVMNPAGGVVMGSGRRHELIELKDIPDQIGAEGGAFFGGLS